MQLLAGKHAVVTGSARGIGFTIASTFASQGASVTLSDIDEAAAEEAAGTLQSAGFRVTHEACDVTVEDDVNRLVDNATRDAGRLDIFVNNAGITRDATLPKMTVQDFRTVVDVHLTGAWLGVRAASQAMKETGGGSIINMSSIVAKGGNFGQTNYAAAKAGIVALTKSAAKELAKHQIRVNAIQPGFIRTAMTDAIPADRRESLVASIPLRRIGEPEDVANVAVFLASEWSSFMTGTVTEVTGGTNM